MYLNFEKSLLESIAKLVIFVSLIVGGYAIYGVWYTISNFSHFMPHADDYHKARLDWAIEELDDETSELVRKLSNSD